MSSIIGEITGANEVGRATQRAGEAQAQAAEAGVAEQRRQFDISQEAAAPFTQAGADAINQQRILLGLGSNAPTDPNQVKRNELERKISGLSISPDEAGTPAGEVKANIIAGLQRQLAEIPEFVAPAQPSAQAQQEEAFSRLAESPGQQFLRQRQEKALLRNAAATGGLGGGNVLTALQQQAAGFAQQDIQNQFSRLGQLAGQGQQATTNVAQLGGTTASNIANLTGQAGAARASGILGPAQARFAQNQQILGLGATIAGAS